MKYFALRSTVDNAIIFDGKFKNLLNCLETAVKEKIPLHFADLKNKNLTNANLDDAILAYADFSGSNLTGANLSEAYLKNANFSNTALYNTCFSYSNMAACDFKDARFGGTDIAGTIIDGAAFSSLSAFTLDFALARQMKDCLFINHNGQASLMSRPPLVLKGYGQTPIILTDEHLHAGHNRLDHERLLPLIEKLSKRAANRRLQKSA